MTQFLPHIPFLLQAPHPTPPQKNTPSLHLHHCLKTTRNTMFCVYIMYYYYCFFFPCLPVCLGQNFFFSTEKAKTGTFSPQHTHTPPTPHTLPPIPSFFFLTLFVFVLLLSSFPFTRLYSLPFFLFFSLLPPYPFLDFVYFASKIGSLL